MDRWLRRGFALLAFAAAVPLWVVRRPPIQDLPQHLAAIRVLHDYADPALDFARYFTLELGRTQYLAYYLAADLLAYPFGVELANRLLMSAFVVGTPFALRALCEATGNDWRLATLGFALTYNAHLILGFLNFLTAIPLCLYGLALCVRERRAPRRARALGLAVLSLVCFYTHVVPFAFLALGVALLAPWSRPRAVLRHGLVLVPAGLSALVWALSAPAGRATLAAASGGGGGARAQFQPAATALAELPSWLTDVFQGSADRELLWVYGALLLGCLLWGLGRAVLHRATQSDSLGCSLRMRLTLLSPLAALAYFVLPTGYDWIWPIAQRFPLLSLWLLVPVLPRPGRVAGQLVLVLAVMLGSAHLHFAGKAFSAFARHEVGELDEALAQIPEGQRVAALIFERGSRHVRYSPFLHYGAYYQADKGGAVMFSFADFAQSPFRFREGNRPPRVPPRWEWMPERVDPERDLGWFDYVLVRGGPGRIARQSRSFERLHQGERWSVWRRRPAPRDAAAARAGPPSGPVRCERAPAVPGTLPTLERVWTHAGEHAVFSSPRVADVTADGVADVFIGHGAEARPNTDQSWGYAVAIDGATGDELWRTEARQALVASALVADLDHDELLEVYLAGRNAELMRVDARTGQVRWRFHPEPGAREAGWYNFYTPQSVPDRNGDGVADLLLSNGGDSSKGPGERDRPASRLALIDASTGALLEHGRAPDGGETYMSPVLHPGAEGAVPHVLMGTGGESLGGHLYRVALSRLSRMHAEPLASARDKGFIASPSLGDLNLDGVLDIVVASVDGSLRALDGRTGERLWEHSEPDSESYSSPALGFFDDDPVPDVFAVFLHGAVPTFDAAIHVAFSGATGEPLWRAEVGVWSASGFVAADLDADGLDEVLFGVNTRSPDALGDSRYQLYLFDPSERGARPWGEPLSQLSFAQPWLGDLDADGCLDLLVPHSHGIDGEDTRGALTRFRVGRAVPDRLSWGGFLGTAGDGRGPEPRRPVP